MALDVTWQTLTDPISKGEIERNFIDVETWSGSLTGDNFAATAAIDVDKLAAKFVETYIVMKYLGGSGIPAVGTVLDTATIPGSNEDEPWSYVGHAWVCTDTGDGLGKVEFDYGYYDVNGDFVPTSIASGVPVTLSNSGAGANSPHQGGLNAQYSGGDFIPYTSNIHTIRMLSHSQGTNYLSAATDFLVVTLRLMRRMQE